MSSSGKGSKWTAEEDARLTAAVQQRSCANCPNAYRPDCPCATFMKRNTWDEIAKQVGGGRTHGGVQGRWCSVLDPKLDLSPWTDELDKKLLSLYKNPEFSTWVLRARELSAPGLRRNGAAVAERYFKLVKDASKQKIKRNRRDVDEE